MPTINDQLERAQKATDNDLKQLPTRQWFGGMSREELKRRSAEGRARRKLLKEHAKQVGAEVTEWVDDFGKCHTATYDEIIVRKFAADIIKRPTPAKVLAWQQLKGEHVPTFSPAAIDASKPAAELKTELAALIQALNASGAGLEQPDTIQEAEPVAIQEAETTDGDTVEVVEADEIESTPHNLPWLKR